MAVFMLVSMMVSFALLALVAMKRQRNQRVTSMRKMGVYPFPRDYDPTLDEVNIPDRL